MNSFHELMNLQHLYDLIEELHKIDPHPILSMYKACTVEMCQGKTLVELAQEEGAQIFDIADIGELKPELGHRPGIGILKEGCCDFYILFKGESDFNTASWAEENQ